MHISPLESALACLLFSATVICAPLSATSDIESLLALATRDASYDVCRNIGYDGISRYDCPKKAGHEVNSRGDCPISVDSACKSYCEVRRTGFLTPVQPLPGNAGAIFPAGSAPDLQKGTEISITHNFGIAADGVFKEVFSLGVSYEYSVSTTATTTLTFHASDANATYSQWVFFGIMVETCGTGSYQSFWPGCSAPGCQNRATCEGPIQTFGNVCSRTPLYLDGEISLIYLQRYMDGGGNQVTLDLQLPSYRKLCQDAVNSGQGNICGFVN